MIDDYMLTDLSPYRLNSDASTLISKLRHRFSPSLEQKVIILINAAEAHPNISKYQIAATRKMLGDFYYENGYYAAALTQYRLGLELNPRMPVKRRVKELEAAGDPGRLACSPDMVEDVLQFAEYKMFAEHEHQLRTRRPHSDGPDYDPEWEAEIAARLAALGSQEQEEFHRLRARRGKLGYDRILSAREEDELTLRAMERSFQYRKAKGE